MNIHFKFGSLVAVALLLLAGCEKRFVEEEKKPAEPVSAIPVESQLSDAELAAQEQQLRDLFENAIAPILEEPISTESAPLAQLSSDDASLRAVVGNVCSSVAS